MHNLAPFVIASVAGNPPQKANAEQAFYIQASEEHADDLTPEEGETEGSFSPQRVGDTAFLIMAEHGRGEVFYYPFRDERQARLAFSRLWDARILYDLTTCGEVREVERRGWSHPASTIRRAVAAMARRGSLQDQVWERICS